MTNETSFFQRAIAACGALALTVGMLSMYFAAPAVQATSGMLA